MLKKMSLRKIEVTTCALVILFIIYMFPDNNLNLNVNKVSYEENLIYKSVYLVDRYDYVSKVMINVSNDETLSLAKEKIEYLIIDSNKTNEIPNGFKPIIPSNTKVKDISLDKDTINIFFSSDFNNISLEYEEKMIEAIVYTVTDIEGINKVNIYVEEDLLTKLPKSNRNLDMPLTRKYGINKVYDFDSLNNVEKTTIYYLNDRGNNIYYVPVTHINNDNSEKISIIVNELKSSVLYQSNLSSYLNAVSELEDYQIVEDTMYLSFNNKLFNDINSKEILEEVKYTINMSIKENYDVSSVIYLVDGTEIEKIELKMLE